MDVVRELRDGVADRVPVTLRGLPVGSWAVSWRAAVVALVLAVVVGTALLAKAQGAPAEAGATVPRRTAPASPLASSAGRTPDRPVPSGSAVGSLGAAEVVVHVVGRVRRPGLVRLPPGSRVSDAVTAAGGPAAEARLDRLNLARLLGDGEQILVPGATDPVPPVAAAAGPAGPAGSGTAAGGAGAAGEAGGTPVDLNAATAGDLDALPGVGPVLAGRILAWRAQHGRFSRVAELGEVPGIGDKLLAQLTPLVRV